MVESSPNKYNWNCFVYLSEINYVAPPECNEGDLEWIPMSDLAEIPTPATDGFIYQYVAESKNFMFNVEYDNNLKILEMKEEIEDEKIVGM